MFALRKREFRGTLAEGRTPLYRRQPKVYFGGMRKAVAMVTCLLAGCVASYQDLERREIVGTYRTEKPRAEFAACVAESLSIFGAPMIAERGGDTVVTFNYQGSTDLMVIIAPNGNVSVRRAQIGINFRSRLERCL